MKENNKYFSPDNSRVSKAMERKTINVIENSTSKQSNLMRNTLRKTVGR